MSTLYLVRNVVHHKHAARVRHLAIVAVVRLRAARSGLGFCGARAAPHGSRPCGPPRVPGMAGNGAAPTRTSMSLPVSKRMQRGQAWHSRAPLTSPAAATAG